MSASRRALSFRRTRSSRRDGSGPGCGVFGRFVRRPGSWTRGRAGEGLLKLLKVELSGGGAAGMVGAGGGENRFYRVRKVVIVRGRTGREKLKNFIRQ